MPNQNIDLRSDEVHYILSRIPHWIIRWGNILVLLITITVFSIAAFIQYPDVINASIVLTSQVDPENVKAGSSGRFLKIFVINGQEVGKDRPLAILSNTADFNNVYELKKIMDTLTVSTSQFNFPVKKINGLNLGELSLEYSLFEKDYYAYQLNEASGSLKNRNVIEADVIFFKNAVTSYWNLKNAVANWERRYVLKSSLEGKVSFLREWKEGQSIDEGSNIFTVVPTNTTYKGKITTSIQNFNKIKIGQKVNIKLFNYPEKEFGLMEGKISSLCEIPDAEDNIVAEVSLPESLKTKKNVKISINHELAGSADIITKDSSLLHRIFQQFFI